MEKIIEACADLDYSWLEKQIGDFTLHIDQCEVPLGYGLFHYENPLGWRWEALYDKEVEDYSVRIVMPLFEYVDISFVRDNIKDFWRDLPRRYIKEITNTFIEPQRNFDYTYRKKGIPDWKYESCLPERIGNFFLDVTPDTGIRMINGSYIIIEYRKESDKSGLIVFFNIFRDEFFAELRVHNYPQIDHHLDAQTIPELEENLKEHLLTILNNLERKLQN